MVQVAPVVNDGIEPMLILIGALLCVAGLGLARFAVRSHRAPLETVRRLEALLKGRLGTRPPALIDFSERAVGVPLILYGTTIVFALMALAIFVMGLYLALDGAGLV